MSAEPSRPPTVVYSVGHSNHALEHLLVLLRDHQIDVLERVQKLYNDVVKNYDGRPCFWVVPSFGRCRWSLLPVGGGTRRISPTPSGSGWSRRCPEPRRGSADARRRPRDRQCLVVSEASRLRLAPAAA